MNRVRINIVKPPTQESSIYDWAFLDTPHGWEDFFNQYKDYIEFISEKLDDIERREGIYYPPKQDVFRAFRLVPLHKVKVVILGQDPYPQFGKAVGLSFSLPRDDRKINSSLRTIYHELCRTVEGFKMPEHGDLTEWAMQGVLLLNQSLTVQPNSSDSHKGLWMGFIRKTVETICSQCPGTIFMLWGAKAQNLQDSISNKCHVLTAGHPSFANAKRSFTGCDHFNRANELLISQKKDPIDWTISP